jgi:hypothetical protein
MSPKKNAENKPAKKKLSPGQKKAKIFATAKRIAKKALKRPVPQKVKKPEQAAPAKRAVKVKKVAYVKSAPPGQEMLDKLFHKAQSRNFITEQELSYAFPEVEDYIPVFEAFIDQLTAQVLPSSNKKRGCSVAPKNATIF